MAYASRRIFSRIRPKKDFGGTAGEGVYNRQEPFAKMKFFKVGLKCFPMENYYLSINNPELFIDVPGQYKCLNL